jgi:general secretion pathway protein D
VKDRKPTAKWNRRLGYLVTLLGILLAAPLTGLGQTPAKPNASVNPALNTGQRFVSIDFNDVDINVFVKFMSVLTGMNFVIDERVRGKVTIISPSKISVDEAYQVFESVLEVHGFATVKSKGVVKIIPTTDARTKSIETRIREESGGIDDQIITQIIPLKFANPDEIKRLLTPLIGRSSVILSYPDTNTLIITDTGSNIKRLTRILDVVDVAGTGQNITVIPVKFADASKLVTILGTVFKPDSRSRSRSRMVDPISFVADERTNAIILLSSETDALRVKELVTMLDKETPRGKGNINVYYLENATAEDVAAVLQDIPKQGDKSAQTEGKRTAPVVSDKVRITADKATNSLIILADKEDYEVLKDIIKKIDIPRAMVYIEALIMEVNLTKGLELGTEWQVGDRTNFNKDRAIVGGGWNSGDQLLNVDPKTGVPVLPTGFSLGIFGETIDVGGIKFPSVGAVAKAFQKNSNANILSTPQVLTTDNEEAKIVVAKNLAFQTTATTSSGSSSDVYNSFEYRDVGKTLTITPHISKDRMVRLKIALEVSSVEDANNNRPTTKKRTVDTTVIVKDSNTIVIGGLIDDESRTGTRAIPCLGSIPIVGWLFKNQTNNNDKTNLYVFLTPKVVKSPDEADNVYNEKRNHIQGLQEGKIKMYNQNKNSSGPVIISDPNLDDNGAGKTQNPDDQDQKKEGGYE